MLNGLHHLGHFIAPIYKLLSPTHSTNSKRLIMRRSWITPFGVTPKGVILMKFTEPIA